MVIRIICVGRIKERHWAEAAAEYERRLTRYVRLETAELRECTDKNPEVARRKEAALILGQIRRREGYAVALEPRGKRMTSEEFATLLKKPEITLIIGGPDGLDQSVHAEADLALSLSDMTFPHQLARVILLEQIYRGQTILKGERYHR
jgi:23S rRNA (pseudouridine1915-N3)-methyltransferase